MKNTSIVNTVKEAKEISFEYLKEMELENVIGFGLPEIDDRYQALLINNSC